MIQDRQIDIYEVLYDHYIFYGLQMKQKQAIPLWEGLLGGWTEAFYSTEGTGSKFFFANLKSNQIFCWEYYPMNGRLIQLCFWNNWYCAASEAGTFTNQRLNNYNLRHRVGDTVNLKSPWVRIFIVFVFCFFTFQIRFFNSSHQQISFSVDQFNNLLC